MSPRRPPLRFSLVIPLHDEEDNVAALLDEVAEVLGPHGPFEAVVVEDGSRDRTWERLVAWKEENRARWLRLLPMAANSGQSAAVLAGARAARADRVLAMDGDLQNDPRDLVRMLEIMDKGPRVGVVGVRVERRDDVVRRWSSRVGNAVRNRVTGDRVTDAACGIKAFRRRIFLDVPCFDGMHRFMATLARSLGEEVVELPVNHRPRVAGRPKYGIGNRALRGLLDCLAVRWLRGRALRTETAKEA